MNKAQSNVVSFGNKSIVQPSSWSFISRNGIIPALHECEIFLTHDSRRYDTGYGEGKPENGLDYVMLWWKAKGAVSGDIFEMSFIYDQQKQTIHNRLVLSRNFEMVRHYVTLINTGEMLANIPQISTHCLLAGSYMLGYAQRVEASGLQNEPWKTRVLAQRA